MPKKLAFLAAALALVAAACGERPSPEVDLGGEGPRFAPELVDFQDDVGSQPRLALGPEGTPFVAYLGFPQPVAEGEIAPIRPVGSPSVPGVLLSAKIDGVWNRGAVAMREDTGAIVAPPFGPAELAVFQDLESGDVTGLDMTVDGEGAVHVAYSTADSVSYATNAGGPFEVEEVRPLGATPVAGAAVAVEEDGAPWISFVAAGEVRVATREGQRWSVDDVAPADPDARTEIGVTGAGPLVAFGAGGSALAATLDGGAWTVEEIGPGGLQVAMAVDGDGNPHVASLDQGGTVHRAQSIAGGAWRSAEVADAGGPDGGSSVDIAVDERGINYVIWRDVQGDRVAMASNDGGTFEEVELEGTHRGWSPTIAVEPDASAVYLAWYDPDNGNLEFGTYGEIPAPELARPSPTPIAPEAPPVPVEPTDCPEPATELTIAAPVGSIADGFDVDCLTAPAGEAVTIDFDNQDTGVPHNVSIFTDETASESLFLADIITGPDQITYDVDALDAGEYFFHCDVHPTTMTGTYLVE